MKVRFKVDCDASLRETWECDLPDNIEPDAINEAIDEKLFNGDCEFIEQTSDNEHNREVDEDSIEVMA